MSHASPDCFFVTCCACGHPCKAGQRMYAIASLPALSWFTGLELKDLHKCGSMDPDWRWSWTNRWRSRQVHAEKFRHMSVKVITASHWNCSNYWSRTSETKLWKERCIMICKIEFDLWASLQPPSSGYCWYCMFSNHHCHFWWKSKCSSAAQEPWFYKIVLVCWPIITHQWMKNFPIKL